MITEINGDIFDTDCDVIAHGCNCVNGFGHGIAGQMAKRYPHVKEAYHSYHKNVGWVLSDVQLVGTDHGRIIANCGTQQEYYPRDRVHADYDAIERVCCKLKDFCKTNNKTLALPRIGCGLAGGDWKIVKEIYERVFDDFDVKVYFI